MEFMQNGAQVIQERIDRALAAGESGCSITGRYEVERTILIPSGFRLEMRDCHLRLKDGVCCNLLANAGCFGSRNADRPDRGIRITGINATLDGGEYNGLSERNSLKDGRPHISRNLLILFSNVEDFAISGLRLINLRWWGMAFFYCRKGVIRDIDFLADCTSVRDDGTPVPYLDRETYGYEAIRVKNADGIDIRCGCRDIQIRDITGFTEDDTVAVTGLYHALEEMYSVPGLSRDIANIEIRSVRSSAFCANVRILNQGGVRIENVLVDGVFDTSKDSPYMSRGETGVNFGDPHSYSFRPATEEETRNIVIRNVFSRAAHSIRISGGFSNCAFHSIMTFDGGGEPLDLTGRAVISR